MNQRNDAKSSSPPHVKFDTGAIRKQTADWARVLTKGQAPPRRASGGRAGRIDDASAPASVAPLPSGLQPQEEGDENEDESEDGDFELGDAVSDVFAAAAMQPRPRQQRAAAAGGGRGASSATMAPSEKTNIFFGGAPRALLSPLASRTNKVWACVRARMPPSMRHPIHAWLATARAIFF